MPTVNGKADAVLMDTSTYENHLKAANMARLLAPAEEDITAGRTKPVPFFPERIQTCPQSFALESPITAERDLEEVWNYIANDSP